MNRQRMSNIHNARNAVGPSSHRLPNAVTELIPNPMPALAVVSGTGLLAVSLLAALAVDTEPRALIVRCTALFAAWPIFLALVYFLSSRSLRTGTGWLATRRGWRWHVIHLGDLEKITTRSPLGVLAGGGRHCGCTVPAPG